MLITKLDLRLVRLPYKEPIHWASSSESAAECLLLTLHTDDGLYGMAEVSDKPTWTGATVHATAQVLHEIYEPLLIGQNPLATERIWVVLDKIPGWGSAKTLIDVALTDLAARHAGLPLWMYLGGWTDEVPVSWLATRGPYEQRLAEIRGAIERHGFTALKVKIGTDPEGDVAFLRRLREGLGASIAIAVDANSSYSPRQAVRVGEALAELDVSLYEDPCPLPLGERTSDILRRSPVPILVDKLAGSLEQAKALVSAGAAAVALKLPRTGYRWSERIRQVCEEAGVQTAVGLSTESGLGSLMALHLHGAHKHFQSIPAENSFFLHMQDDILTEPLTIKQGKVRLPSGPGLGVELDERVLERLSQRI